MMSTKGWLSRRPGHSAAAIFMAAALAAGCTAEAKQGPEGTPSGAGSSHEDAAPQPFDVFLGAELGFIEYATKKIRDACMRDAGFPQLQKVSTGKPARLFEELIVTPGTFMPASDELARSRGFGRDLPAKPARLVSKDPSFDQNLERCGKQSWEAIGPDANQVWKTYFELGNELTQAMVPVYRAHPPSKVGESMAECLAGEGYVIPNKDHWVKEPSINVFGVPFGRHAEPVEARWQPRRDAGDVQIGPAVPPAPYVPTEGEKKLATAWRKCGTAAGFDDFFLDMSMRQQKITIDRLETQFTELNPQITSLAKKAAALTEST
ncbi:hypothetical protein [Micromonospora noduli]|uniref:hypothetical protein n=1 Tax=Micromonospora noduli TaxID=709876 RepID=UPI000DC2E9EC|nr:hypothetical protein [Micromonospora noduli]RAO22833.1 hypothetical protein LUPAC07_00429 [Micromonospora noduli]